MLQSKAKPGETAAHSAGIISGRKIRIMVAGLGWVAQNRHIPQIRRNADFELVGLLDRRPDRARNLAEKLGVPNWERANDLAQVDWLEKVDAVAVTTAPEAHSKFAIAALEAGKHVLLEKPFAMSVDEGRAIVAEAENSDRTLGIVHNFQFSNSVRALDRDLESGALGDILSVSGVQLGNPSRRLPEWYEELPLGLFYDESPHFFYLLDHLAKAPLKVDRVEKIASLQGHKTPAQVNVTLFEAGGRRPFSVRCNFEAPVSEWHLFVCGERAMGIVDLFRDIYIHLPNDGAHTAWPVLRSSLAVSWAHWSQVVTRGLGHISGRLYYGNDEVYGRFGKALLGENSQIEPISAQRAQRVLELQHAAIQMSE